MVPAFKGMGIDATNDSDIAAIVNMLRAVREPKLTDGKLTSWCSAFVYDCMRKAEIPAPATSHARHWLKWGVPALTPFFGCVAIRWRGKTDDKNKGHVAFYLFEDSECDFLLGGNQSKRVQISRFKKSTRLGFRQYGFEGGRCF
jgi:uncharacterized protein (TIGR02594 family)